MAKRSFGVVLIATLLVWSVNLPAIACTAMNSRAAVMVRAGASPAPKPEPSSSHHSCCPVRKISSAPAHPADHNCSFHGKHNANCCSISSNPQAAQLPQILTKSDVLKSLGAPATGSHPVQVQTSQALFLSTTSPPIAPQPASSVLRL